MLSGEGNSGERWKTTIGLISQKKATLHVQHTFFVHFFAVVLHDYKMKLPETSSSHVLWREYHTWSRSLFFTAAYFHLAMVAASISHFVTAATKFSCCSFNKKLSHLFSISRSRSLSPFISLSLPPTFSFLCLPPALYSKFADMTINLS